MKGQEMEVAEDMFEGVEELKTPSNTDTSVKNMVSEDTPSMLSPEWHDYAMTLFQEGNTDDMFCAFAVAIASTRAEARALRKVLKIKGVAAEELTKKDTAKIVRDLSKQTSSTSGDYDDSSRMSDAQFNFIDVKCRQLNVNGKKLFKEVCNVDQNSKASKKAASEIIDVLNNYQKDKSSVPDGIVGYNEEWRN